jgi:hypothetical protein
MRVRRLPFAVAKFCNEPQRIQRLDYAAQICLGGLGAFERVRELHEGTPEFPCVDDGHDAFDERCSVVVNSFNGRVGRMRYRLGCLEAKTKFRRRIRLHARDRCRLQDPVIRCVDFDGPKALRVV